jgi:hypothetical protein
MENKEDRTMKENGEVRSKGLEFYKKFNKLTLVGTLGFAAVSAAVAPGLVVPALGLAAVDVGQIAVIDRINKKKQGGVVYQAKKG